MNRKADKQKVTRKTVKSTKCPLDRKTTGKTFNPAKDS